MAGKEFRDDTGAWEIRADGKMVGQFGSDKLQGAWKWDRKAWCRSYVFKGKEKPTECQHMWISGDKVRFRKDRGKGGESVEVLVAK